MRSVTAAALGGALIILVSGGSVSAQAVRGTYLQSCVRGVLNGPILRALCRDTFGRFVPTGIDVRQCRGGDIANLNGQLACAGGRRGGGRRFQEDFYDDEEDYRPRRRPRRDYYDDGF